jgi:hypothetical protein
MRDLDETEVRARLSDLAGGVDLRPPLERPTIRRARRRRAANAAMTALVVVALLGGSYAGMRAVLGGRGTTIGVEPSATPTPIPSPTPTTSPTTEPAFVGVWPETDAEALAEAQRAADEAHQPMRTDAAGTATLFATNLLNWPLESVVVVGTGVEGDTTVVEIRNDAFDEGRSPVVVYLRQLGDAGPGGVWSVVIPPDVAETAARIHEAALARDFDALAALMDPNIFVYNLDDGSDPIPAWREDPSILDTIALVLELPSVAIDVEGMGRFHIWPYLAHAELSDPTPDQLRDLERLGIDAGELRDMVDFGAYIGPRLAIDQTGLWRNFVQGGD